jgi:hypothetical protein
MAETFYFDFFQIPHTGVVEPDLVSQTRSDVSTTIRRPVGMKISNFGALNVGLRMTSDYTRTGLGFKDKGESEDWAVITEDTGIGQNVRLNGVSVNHNPHVWGDTIKYVRDDQFIRMTMTKDTDSIDVNPPKFDVMDTKEVSASAIDDLGQPFKNWPSEGWRSFGGKYDFLPYNGGWTK